MVAQVQIFAIQDNFVGYVIGIRKKYLNYVDIVLDGKRARNPTHIHCKTAIFGAPLGAPKLFCVLLS